MQAYADEGAVKNEKNRDHAITALVDDYLEDMEADQTTTSRLALTHRRKDVHAINQAIKAGLREQQGAKPETLINTDHGPRAFAQDDRILFTKNDATLEVRNGMLGSIQAIDGDQVTVHLDPNEQGQSRKLSFSVKNYPSIDHGFAVSIHRSQGCTVDKSYVLSSKTLDRNLLYVAMTRHREAARFYTARPISRKLKTFGIVQNKRQLQIQSPPTRKLE
jgi:ATP-dependent exoDNAse (exonuclease V) alpha subunit